MKSKSMLIALLLVLHSTPYAAEKKPPSPEQAAQHARMKSCNAEAKEKKLKGDERKTFMSGCLKSKTS